MIEDCDIDGDQIVQNPEIELAEEKRSWLLLNQLEGPPSSLLSRIAISRHILPKLPFAQPGTSSLKARY
jgi:hypothetical protein